MSKRISDSLEEAVGEANHRQSLTQRQGLENWNSIHPKRLQFPSSEQRCLPPFSSLTPLNHHASLVLLEVSSSSRSGSGSRRISNTFAEKLKKLLLLKQSTRDGLHLVFCEYWAKKKEKKKHCSKF